MPAPTLEGRLLCACVTAHTVTTNQTPIPLNPDTYLDGTGWLKPPVGFVSGPLSIDACLVGEIDLGIVLAFRGTMSFDPMNPPSLRDWLNNFQALPKTSPDFPGDIHEGFLDTWDDLDDLVLNEVARIQATYPAPRPVYVTGHSKGGAIAALAAWRLSATGAPLAKVITFAAPKPGDAIFATAYANAGITHERYEYGDDIVPHLPLSDEGFIDVLNRLPIVGHQFTVANRFDYQPVGTLFYYDTLGHEASDAPMLRTKRDLALALEIIRGHFTLIGAHHSISCGSGYGSAIIPTGVCPVPSA